MKSVLEDFPFRIRVMEKAIGRKLAKQEMDVLRARSYRELSELIGHPFTKNVIGPDGKSYQVGIQAFWNDEPGGDVRVSVSVDDGGWRALIQVTDSFIVSARGQTVVEKMRSACSKRGSPAAGPWPPGPRR